MNFTKEKISNIDQQDIFKITLTNNHNYSISFFNFGGYIHSILIPYLNKPDKQEDVLLGYNKFENYITDKSYFICIVGRVCGRIANSKFYLNNKKYKLFSNYGRHHLHGGQGGFNKKIWNINFLDKNSDEIICILDYLSSDTEEGYPGNVECTTKYTLNNKNEFIIQFNANTDSDTIIGLTNHNYWNFHGHNSMYQNILDHSVNIKAQLYCDADTDLIPTGKLLKVEQTKFDFQKNKIVDCSILKDKGIDVCYYIKEFDGKIKEVASVFSTLTKMGLNLYSNQPGLQFYTGNMMDNHYVGKYSKKYGNQYGLCLEPQLFPDAINHNNFISPILRKNEQYSSLIIMKLRNDF